MDKYIIGENAGKVWRLLNSDHLRKWEFSEIKKITGMDDAELDAPEKGKLYYVPNFIAAPLCYHWANDKFDLQLLAKGLVHLTEENAEAHAKALVALTSK